MKNKTPQEKEIKAFGIINTKNNKLVGVFDNDPDIIIYRTKKEAMGDRLDVKMEKVIKVKLTYEK